VGWKYQPKKRDGTRLVRENWKLTHRQGIADLGKNGFCQNREEGLAGRSVKAQRSLPFKVPQSWKGSSAVSDGDIPGSSRGGASSVSGSELGVLSIGRGAAEKPVSKKSGEIDPSNDSRERVADSIRGGGRQGAVEGDQ